MAFQGKIGHIVSSVPSTLAALAASDFESGGGRCSLVPVLDADYLFGLDYDPLVQVSREYSVRGLEHSYQNRYVALTSYSRRFTKIPSSIDEDHTIRDEPKRRPHYPPLVTSQAAKIFEAHKIYASASVVPSEQSYPGSVDYLAATYASLGAQLIRNPSDATILLADHWTPEVAGQVCGFERPPAIVATPYWTLQCIRQGRMTPPFETPHALLCIPLPMAATLPVRGSKPRSIFVYLEDDAAYEYAAYLVQKLGLYAIDHVRPDTVVITDIHHPFWDRHFYNRVHLVVGLRWLEISYLEWELQVIDIQKYPVGSRVLISDIACAYSRSARSIGGTPPKLP